MNNLSKIKGNNNKILFILDDKSEIENFTEKEIDLINNFNLSVTGNGNTIKVKIDKREDIESFLKSEGLYISVVGDNNKINLDKIKYTVNPLLGITGLKIFIGGEADPFLSPDLPRYASGCSVEIGNNTVFCGTRIYMQDDNSSVKIGDNCMFSWGIDVWCTDVHTITDLNGNPQNYGKSIEIGNHVWVGKDVKIGKNTKISNDSIIGWGSIVTKKFDETNVIIAGNPAKIIKQNINWDPRDLQNYKLYKEYKNTK